MSPSGTTATLVKPARPGATRLYVCKCGQTIFFRNSLCIACNTPLGYDPNQGMLYPLRPGPDADLWERAVPGYPRKATYRLCANLNSPAGCNWLIPVTNAKAPAPSLCIACRLNRTIPDLSVPGNPEKWRRIEVAKRRLVASLLRLRLPVPSHADDPGRGLAFDFLATVPGGPPVMTGYAGGVITLNIAEAEDVQREQVRVQMNEPYRTILGHLRHESGHHYWRRIVADSPRLYRFRELFGDERQDYAAALQRHHSQGPPPGWGERFVSAYAAAHPSEDWAETWAHYLHMTDTLDTAAGFHLQLGRRSPISGDTFTADVLCEPDQEGSEFLPLINTWVKLTSALNELSLSMGRADFYPFILSPAAVTKLHFVHIAIQRANA